MLKYTLIAAATIAAAATFVTAAPTSAAPAKTPAAPAKTASAATAYNPAKECEKIVNSLKPSWFTPAQWTIKCVNKNSYYNAEYYISSRTIQINTRYGKENIVSGTKWAYNAVGKAYRNNPVKDCANLTKKYQPILSKQAKNWKLSCTTKPIIFKDDGITQSGNIVGLATYGSKHITVLASKRTYAEMEETIAHEMGHAVASTWTAAEVRNWNAITKSRWDDPQYNKRGTEMWAESYAQYFLNRKIKYPVAKTFDTKTVKKQLQYVATH